MTGVMKLAFPPGFVGGKLLKISFKEELLMIATHTTCRKKAIGQNSSQDDDTP